MSNSPEVMRITITAKDEFTPQLGVIAKKARDTKKDLDETMTYKLTANVAQLEIMLKQARKMLKEATSRDEQIKLTLATQQFQRELTEAKRKLNNYLNTGDENVSRLQMKFNNLGDSIKDVFSGGGLQALDGFLAKIPMIGGYLQIALGFALSLGRALIQSGRSAQEFEDAFAGVRKTIEDTEVNLKTLEQGLINLSTQIPMSVKELAGIAESAGQLGVANENILKFTETIAQLSVSTNLTSEAAATDFARIASITQTPLENIDRMGSTVVALGNNFETTEREIVEFSNRIAGAGSIVGLTTDQIFAISTAFSSVGIEAEAGGTAVQKVLFTINNAVNQGGKDLEAYARIAGQSASDFKENWNSNTAQGFLAFVSGLKNAGTDANLVLAEMGLNDVRLQRSFLSLSNAGDKLKDALDLANNARSENNALQEEADKRFQTTTSQIAIQDNKWKAFSASIGKYWNMVWLPVYKGLTTFFLDVIPRWFTTFSTAIHNIRQLWHNFGNSIWQVLGNIPTAFTKSINFTLDAIEGMINSASSGLNKFLDLLKKIPGVAGMIGNVNIGTVSFGRIKEGSRNLPNKDSIMAGMKDFESLSSYKNKSYEIASNQVKDNIKQELLRDISMLEDLQNINSNDDNKGGGGAKSRTRDLIQELEKQKALEIKAVQDSEATEEEKMEKLQAIKIKYDKKKLELEKKSDDHLLKEAQQYMKKMENERNNNLKDHNKKSDQAMADIERYKEKIDTVKDKFGELKEKASETLRGINQDLKHLESDHIAGLGARYYEVSKQLRDNELATPELTRLAEGNSVENLEQMLNSGVKELSGVDLSKIIEHVKLKQELLLLEQHTTLEQQEQAKIQAEKSQTTKLIEQYNQQKQALLEKKGIIEAINNMENIDSEATIKINEETDTLSYYDKQKQARVDVIDAKNEEYARDLLNQQQKLNTEYENNKKHLEKNQQLAIEHSKAVIALRNKETSQFQYELDERNSAMKQHTERMNAMISQLQQAQALSRSSVVNNNQITNSNNRTTNHNYTIIGDTRRRPSMSVGLN